MFYFCQALKMLFNIFLLLCIVFLFHSIVDVGYFYKTSEDSPDITNTF